MERYFSESMKRLREYYGEMRMHCLYDRAKGFPQHTRISIMITKITDASKTLSEVGAVENQNRAERKRKDTNTTHT